MHLLPPNQILSGRRRAAIHRRRKEEPYSHPNEENNEPLGENLPISSLWVESDIPHDTMNGTLICSAGNLLEPWQAIHGPCVVMNPKRLQPLVRRKRERIISLHVVLLKVLSIFCDQLA
jgi:hypothetical protein